MNADSCVKRTSDVEARVGTLKKRRAAEARRIPGVRVVVIRKERS